LRGQYELRDRPAAFRIFFRSKDQKALRQWCEQHRGVSFAPSDDGQIPWQQVWMINFRVRDLSAMVAQFQAAGLEVAVDAKGNPVELWQPSAT
jgi:glyoxylase I family protein